MGRQWNQIIESLGPLTGGTMSINANLGDIEALLTTLQADVADGITVSSGTVTANGGTEIGTLGNSGGIIALGVDDVGSANPLVLDGNGNLAIFGTVTANPTYATSGGTGPTTFTSTSYGTIAASNSNRKGLTVFNEGAGNLHITIGTATTSTSSYTIRISGGDYYELPYNYTGLIGGIFATAGTARVTEIV